MNKYNYFQQMKSEGASPRDLYLIMQREGIGPIERIKRLRENFGPSLLEAKDISVTADGTAESLESHQEKLTDSLAKFFQRDENGSF